MQTLYLCICVRGMKQKGCSSLGVLCFELHMSHLRMDRVV